MKVLSIAAGKHLMLIPVTLPQPNPAVPKSILRISASETREDTTAFVKWSQRTDGGIDLEHPFLVDDVAWHSQGDYFATVQPTGGTKVSPPRKRC